MGRILSSAFSNNESVPYALNVVATRGAFGAETLHIGAADAPDRWPAHRLFGVFRSRPCFCDFAEGLPIPG